ncbi:disulfide bond formation protein B [Rhizobium paknamense]|uniref:Disulfide bond formation protein DsbB n=1 Tax=Rhizobium paknamense TaxID=1206817 RepID=A0ABU0IE63_9HYPH|nr:disulfide bond formation protein B [Rhizobium paknamense]MDQ0456528.1 disulfide bond formation protein DsbB [Rhizobium paknamense]
MSTPSLSRPVLPLAAMTLGMAVVVGSALAFEYLGGYIPCELCLLERKPFYIGAAIGLVALLAAPKLPPKVLKLVLMLLGLIMLVSMGLGVYHAGVEWKFWEGPSACSATAGAGFTGTGNILEQLNTIHGPSCTDAALRVLGISFAGWNAIVSLFLAGFAFFSAKRLP